jgi:TonB C terminal
MPTSESKVTENEQEAVLPEEATAEAAKPEEEGAPKPAFSTSRWVDYGTHELLEMISELEDERRWARLREGILWALLLHILLISAFTWIPRYVLREPRVIDPFDAIQKRKDLTYLDMPPDLMQKMRPKVEIKPVPRRLPPIDKKLLEEMSKPSPETAPPPTPQSETKTPAPVQPAPTTPPVQSQVEAPRPQAVPARPNFAMGSQNPADQLQQAMRGAARSPAYGADIPSSGPMRMHPGAGAGGVQVLSDTQGVDFSAWLQRWYNETERTWDPLIPDEVNPPISKQGAVQIRFKVLPNGRIMDGSMQLEGRSGDTGLDRAAWGALTGSNYPPLPHNFHGPYLELRAVFLYNMEPPQQ